MMSTEGSESNRYQKIYSELMSGKKICTDEESNTQSVYESTIETDKRYYTINIGGVDHIFTDVYKRGNHISAYEVNKTGKPGKFLHRLSQAEIDRAVISDTFPFKKDNKEYVVESILSFEDWLDIYFDDLVKKYADKYEIPEEDVYSEDEDFEEYVNDKYEEYYRNTNRYIDDEDLEEEFEISIS